MSIDVAGGYSRTEPESITLLGGTGSIGQSTLDIIRENPGRFRLGVVTAGQNSDRLIEIAREFKPQAVAVADEGRYTQVRDALSGLAIDVFAGTAGLIEAASIDTDFTMAAIMGTAGLEPTYTAICRGTRIGLANKECLVSAGTLVMQAARTYKSEVLPVDSEHNAIYQVFDKALPESVERLILTASGGPFRTKDAAHIARATPDEALRHPNWSMGAKITIDSASLMNKGLEIIEAYHLFPVEPHQIDVVVHPQSIVHSMVEYRDGSVLAQMGTPDMRIPISYAMSYPERISTSVERLNFAAVARMEFEAPDYVRFPCLRIAKEAMQEGQLATLIMNAANEVAVAAFLARKILFGQIAYVVEKTLERHIGSAQPRSIAETLAVDADARKVSLDIIDKLVMAA